MKQLLILSCLLAGAIAFAQTARPTADELQKELGAVQTEVQSLKTKTQRLESDAATLRSQLKNSTETVEALQQTVAELQKAVSRNQTAIDETARQLGVKITDATQTAKNHIKKVGSNTTLYVIIVFLLALLLTGAVYWYLNKRQKSDSTAVRSEIEKTKEQLAKIEEMMNDMPDLIADIAKLKPGDHSLALKVAGEINVMERNISKMADDVKGLKQLKRSLGTLCDNLAANGYEVIPLLGKQYNSGMKLIVINSILDENLEPGDEIITKVILPQVHYQGKMIQSAQVELTIGPEKDDDEPAPDNAPTPPNDNDTNDATATSGETTVVNNNNNENTNNNNNLQS
jgi:uncharacterized protein YoxC